MAMQTIEPVLVSRGEAARMLGVSRNTIIRLAERGKLREVRFSPEMHPRIPISDVLALAGTGDADDATSGARPDPARPGGGSRPDHAGDGRALPTAEKAA